MVKKRRGVSYSKWGYIFIAPFFLAFIIFSLYPIFMTFYYSFFERFRMGLNEHGPYFIGFDNYRTVLGYGTEAGLFGTNLWLFFRNTLIMWVLGFVPQVTVALLLAAWFTDSRLNLKFQGFFKTVIYLPNIIMAAAFSMLMFVLFDNVGPINDALMAMGIVNEPVRFLASTEGTRGLIALMNFLMWFGNTTILLMAAMMGIDPGLFEAAEIDGASARTIFWKITLPLINPILVYVMITSMIGGLQMFDIPQVLTNSMGGPNNTTMTLMMHLNQHLFSRNFGMAGAFSAIMFVALSLMGLLVFKSVTSNAMGGSK